MATEQSLPAQIDALLDRGEDQGCLHISELYQFVQLHELDEAGVEELYDLIESRGFEVTDDCARDGEGHSRTTSWRWPRRTR